MASGSLLALLLAAVAIADEGAGGARGHSIEAKEELAGYEDYWSEYPIYVKATAGMRELPEQQRDAIIAARALAGGASCPFRFENDEQARVIAGEEEAAYAWVAVNFLPPLRPREFGGSTGRTSPPKHGCWDESDGRYRDPKPCVVADPCVPAGEAVSDWAQTSVTGVFASAADDEPAGVRGAGRRGLRGGEASPCPRASSKDEFCFVAAFAYESLTTGHGFDGTRNYTYVDSTQYNGAHVNVGWPLGAMLYEINARAALDLRRAPRRKAPDDDGGDDAAPVSREQVDVPPGKRKVFFLRERKAPRAAGTPTGGASRSRRR
ncbi:8-oxo-dGTP phosphohydrolase [Aureococcus anophagefferens]|uniref:8-oxo-dGTP phosphohydrolase n=1 Tax=Aureococcus anophagefferens TaxID=44056 RepID=A0ABR1G911_AURAN